MSLRKIAALLAASGLAVGLIGGSVGAQFADQVTAAQDISVGSFACNIDSATAGAVVTPAAPNGKSVSYTVPPIKSSAAGSAPFSFTVKNNGTIDQELTVTASAVTGTLNPAKFSAVALAPASPTPLAAGASVPFTTGIAWTALDMTDLTDSGSVTWTVSCGEAASVVFDNTPAVLPGNLPSIGPEAYSYNELGAQVQFAGTARRLSSATVIMSDWACQSGDWTGTTGVCTTTPGATFTVPITFNVYSVGALNAVGSLIATKTQTFTIPYRPSADPANCPATTKWWNGSACFNGLANKITFTFAGETMPNNVIFGISFNTDNHGYTPIGGSGSPTDSLNVALNTAALPSFGSFVPNADSAYVNYTYAPFYTDGGAGGVGTFRLDQGGWAGQEPAVQITAN